MSWIRCRVGSWRAPEWRRAAPRSRRCTSGRRRAAETGRRRLAFEELLFIQLALLARRARADAGVSAIALDGGDELTRRWLDGGLPFVLTADQAAAIGELRAELAGSRPAQRLLMGEVGSGKTVVALFAMLRAVEHGCQAALMAPTETLAEQHFATLQSLLGGEPVTLALLTGSTPAARRAEVHGTPCERRVLAGRRHARADRGRGALSLAGGRGGRRAAPLRRAPARRARRQGAAGPRPACAAHDRDADPAHARALRVRRSRRDAPARAAARSAPDPDARDRRRARARPRV